MQLCLRVDGTTRREKDCTKINQPGPFTKHTNKSGKVQWVASIGPVDGGYAPAVNVSFDFHSNNPEVMWKDNAEFLTGSMTFPESSTDSFLALVTAVAPTSQLGIDVQFDPVAASFGWAIRDATEPGAPSLQEVDDRSQVSLPPDAFIMVGGKVYEFRFVGLKTSDGLPTTYSVTLKW